MKFSMNHPNARKVLDCGSPLPLCNRPLPPKAVEDYRSPRRWRALTSAGAFGHLRIQREIADKAVRTPLVAPLPFV